MERRSRRFLDLSDEIVKLRETCKALSLQRFALASLCVMALSSCNAQMSRESQSGSDQDSTQSSIPISDHPAEFGQPRNQLQDGGQGTGASLQSQDQLLQAQANRQEKVEVLFSARVRKLLPDDTQGLPHQRFLLHLDNGSTVLVAHDIKYAPKVPIQEGDMITIKGEYIWNKRGGVVHWTHHTDSPRHEGGYIYFGGNRYQ